MILERITLVRERSWQWFKERAHGKHALFWLCALAFLEAFISPIIPETLMIAMLIAGSERWRRYAFLTSLSSIAGGVFGYVLGLFLFQSVGQALIGFYGLNDAFGEAARLMSMHAFTTMFWATFTLLPDKIFVLSAGFLGVSFLPYFFGYAMGRTARFFLVAYLVHRYGTRVVSLINRYFMLLAIVAGLLIAAVLAESFFFDTVSFL